MADKIYMGSGKEKTFDDGGSVISVHLSLEKIGEYFKDYGYTSASGEKRIKLNIGSRREIGTYGETHTVVLDTWKPDSAGNPFEGENNAGNNSVNSQPVIEVHQGGGGNFDNESDIPF